ncbi:hypothetical protein Tco_0090719 [Tanacetum coccineum]
MESPEVESPEVEPPEVGRWGGGEGGKGGRECKIMGQILLDHPLSYALTATTDVPVVYLQQFWKTVSKVLDTKDTIKFKLDSQETTYTVDMFHNTLHLPVKTLDNPFVAPVNIEIIESFMQRFGYQGVVNKVSAFYTKFLAQPWQTMFKVFNRCLTTRSFWHDQKKINILQLFHVVVSRVNVDYAALLWWDFINCRIDEDYHSIKDDIPLVSVYTKGNVQVRGMLILDAFLTKEIRATDDYTEWSKVKRINNHMETLEHVVDDDENEEEKKYEEKDEKKDDEMGSLENRTEKMQTPIPITPRSPRINLYSDKNIVQELTYTDVQASRIYDQEHGMKMCDNWRILERKLKRVVVVTVIQKRDAFQSEVATLISKEFDVQAPKIIEELFKNYIKSNLQDQANDPVLWDVLKCKFEKSSTFNTSCRVDDFNSQCHDDHQEDDAPPEREKRVKRYKTSKSLKYVRGSLSKQSTKESTSYVTKKQHQQQEWDAWEEEIVIDEDEVIPKDKTPKLIMEFQKS